VDFVEAKLDYQGLDNIPHRGATLCNIVRVTRHGTQSSNGQTKEGARLRFHNFLPYFCLINVLRYE
jgi:hypothetical protein